MGAATSTSAERQYICICLSFRSVCECSRSRSLSLVRYLAHSVSFQFPFQFRLRFHFHRRNSAPKSVTLRSVPFPQRSAMYWFLPLLFVCFYFSFVSLRVAFALLLLLLFVWVFLLYYLLKSFSLCVCVCVGLCICLCVSFYNLKAFPLWKSPFSEISALRTLALPLSHPTTPLFLSVAPSLLLSSCPVPATLNQKILLYWINILLTR